MHKPYAGYAAFIAVCINLLAVKPYPITDLQIIFFLASTLFHTLAISIPQPSFIATITLHASGLLACQTLVFVVLPHSWRCYYYILNAFLLLLLACFFFKHHFIHFLPTSIPHHVTDLEAQHQQLQQIQQTENFDNVELRT
ncbi:hypothetical protein DEO72_LG1g1689 [Vigna unguiculata]|nr:hypothetical protein DEO72_LG1g1688 [Vigna unguiculata]QCD78060.1 hypothetical protein DEO72_LG1g1689 [Vigna unguiculata]